jgi:hypothetical protein
MQRRSRGLEKYGFAEVDGEVSVYTTDNTAPIDVALIQGALTAVARAVYHYHNGKSKKLTSEVMVVPLFLGAAADCAMDWRRQFLKIDKFTRKDFIDRWVFGENQDVFGYQVIEGDGIVFVNMRFYREQFACVVANNN